MDLIEPCQKLGLNLEIAVHVEAANALWDQGEMTSFHRHVAGTRQRLISKESRRFQLVIQTYCQRLGPQVSIARLEKADKILENYLKPALEELKGKREGSEASQVFHQFALFCDQQLQDPDSLEDLEPSKSLETGRQMK